MAATRGQASKLTRRMKAAESEHRRDDLAAWKPYPFIRLILLTPIILRRSKVVFASERLRMRPFLSFDSCCEGNEGECSNRISNGTEN